MTTYNQYKSDLKGVAMKPRIPCPACGHAPTDSLDRRDGEVWICLDFGYQEASATGDIEVYLETLAAVDPILAAC